VPSTRNERGIYVGPQAKYITCRGNILDRNIERTVTDQSKNLPSSSSKLRLAQSEPYLAFAQQFLDFVEEIASLKSSIAHRLG